jgi:hypothetical protein
MMMQAVAKPNVPPALTLRSVGLWLIGSLKEGVSREQAEAELNAINRQLLQEYPPSEEVDSWRTLPLSLAPAQGTLFTGLRIRVAAVIILARIASWGSGRDFDFCYGSDGETKPLTKIKRIVAVALTLDMD